MPRKTKILHRAAKKEPRILLLAERDQVTVAEAERQRSPSRGCLA